MSAFDMERRLEIQLAFLTLMGPHVFDDLRENDSVLSAMQQCAFSGVVLDLSDATTVMELQSLYRGLRLLGSRWSLRAQAFIGILLVKVALGSIVLVLFAFLPRDVQDVSGRHLLVYYIAVPIYTIYYCMGIVLLIHTIDVGAHINFLAESYLPLALETARLRLQMDCFAGGELTSDSESVAVCDGSLVRLRAFVLAMQQARPLRVLGFSTSASVTGVLQVLAITAATSLAKVYNINIF